MSVSRKIFLEHLKTVDYIKFNNISADWHNIINDAEDIAKNNPDYWYSLVVDKDEEFDVWDDAGKEYFTQLQKLKSWGYNPSNTRTWGTTHTRPHITMSWEENVAKQLPLLNLISRPTLQTPGNVLPWHQDKFFNFKRNYPNDIKFIVRFTIFMKDWQIGHVLQAGNSIISHWRAGDCVIWYPDRWHLSANIGINNKWTNNITGILTEEINWDSI